MRRQVSHIIPIRMAILGVAMCASLVSVCLRVSVGSPSNGGWKPVTTKELTMTAAELGDSEADAAILFREGDLNDTYPDGTSLRIYIRIKVFNDRGRRWADVQLPYRVELGRIMDLRARTIRPDGAAVDVESHDIFDKVLLKTNHGIWRAKVFSMPAVEPGSIIEYRYREVYPHGFRYFALDLQSDLYTKELYYRIRPRPASKLDMRWITFNARDSKRFNPQWDGSYYIRAEDIQAYRKEPMMPPERTVKFWGWLYYGDDFEVEPEKYWKEYASRSYARSEAETRPTHAIRKVVETITLPQDKPETRINRIYDYIQSEIKNIGFRDDKNNPVVDSDFKRNDSADDTIRRRYGTPSEINRLFIAMVRAAGQDARVAELTTRDEASFHRNFADSLQFNSDVVAVIDSRGHTTFYDPGTEFCPSGMLPWEKEAVSTLIHGLKEPFVDTPLTDASKNEKRKILRAALTDDGSLTAMAEIKLYGQRALEARTEAADFSADELKKHLAESERRGMTSVNIDEATLSTVDEHKSNGVFGLKYGLETAQAVARTEKRLLIRPALFAHPDESVTSLPRRLNSLYFHYPWSETDRIEIKIPSGFSIEQLPDPLQLDIGAAKYQSSFSRSGDLLVFERSLIVNAIYLTPEQYPAAKAFFDRIHQADRAVVSFLQK